MTRSSTLCTYDSEERFGRIKGIRECTQNLPIGERRDDADCGQVFFGIDAFRDAKDFVSIIAMHVAIQEELEKRIWARGLQ